jgi:hypothetical protein
VQIVVMSNGVIEEQGSHDDVPSPPPSPSFLLHNLHSCYNRARHVYIRTLRGLVCEEMGIERYSFSSSWRWDGD